MDSETCIKGNCSARLLPHFETRMADSLVSPIDIIIGDIISKMISLGESCGARRPLKAASRPALIVFEFIFLVDLAVALVPMRQGLAATQRSRHARFARSIGVALRGPRGDFPARC